MRAVLLLALLAGCGEAVDTTALPPVADFQDWDRFEFTGEVPGHGSGCRWVYVNDVGRGYAHAGRYRPGTVLVKEIYEGDCAASTLTYTSVMRRLDRDDPSAAGLPLQNEWLFTDLESPGQEFHYDWCWNRCHQAAPVDGAWYDYGMR